MGIPREFKQIRLCKNKRNFDYKHPEDISARPAKVFRTEYFKVIFNKICASSEPQFDGLKTYSTNFGFLYNISSLKNKFDEDLLSVVTASATYAA
jgi:hypothetical protein